jgi:hypothetical protein
MGMLTVNVFHMKSMNKDTNVSNDILSKLDILHTFDITGTCVLSVLTSFTICILPGWALLTADIAVLRVSTYGKK